MRENSYSEFISNRLEWLLDALFYVWQLMSFRNVIVPVGLVAVQFFISTFLSESNNLGDYDTYKIPGPNQHYDFIVVGSGSAGAVVASRLADYASWDVLLLEAGGPPPPESYVPALYVLGYVGAADWGYKTEPQKHSMFGYSGRSNQYPRGFAIGGSSVTNYMMYVRGNKKDYDNWASMGNKGWDYQTVLQYFKKSEDYKGNNSMNNSEYHGYGGPMRVSSKPWGTPLQQAFLKAGRELGYSVIDPNAASQAGFSTPDVTVKDGIRVSTAEAFLRAKLNLPNFSVVPHCHVTKIIFDENNRAVGVRYLRNQQEHIALAKREVIISAGSIDSPKLLMLSGVGPKEHLSKHNISVIKDLPGVGQNLQDHPVIFGLTWGVNEGSSLALGTLLNLGNLYSYFRTRSGPFSSPFAIEGNAWAQLSDGDPEWPDAQFLLMAATPAWDTGVLFQSLIGYDEQLFETYFKNQFGKEGFCIGPTVLRPKSRGSITLRSSDPLEPPIIDPNFLSHQDDIDLMVRAIKFALRIGNAKAFADDHGAKFLNTPLPGCDHLELESDEYWACYARFMTSTIYHPAGTCKMAPPHDKMGVVDNRLRVYGVKGLRVIDASIMPTVVSGNTNAPAVMIGERGADLIIEEWSNELK